MCSYHYTCHPFQFHFTNLIMPTQPFYKSFRKMLICRLRSAFEKGAVLPAAAPDIFFLYFILTFDPPAPHTVRDVPHTCTPGG